MFFIFSLVFISCSQEIITPDRVINTPVSLSAVSYKNGITVSFFGNNNEEGFQGYNIYISTSQNIGSQNISAVKNNYDLYPTFPYYYTGCYNDGSAKSSLILYKDSSGSSILSHQTYYIAVKALAIINDKNYESEFSGEVSVYVLQYTNFILYNNNITGQSNDSFIFDAFQITDVSAGSMGSADAVFKLISINNKIVPAVVLSDNIMMADIGYFENIYADTGNVNDPETAAATNIILQNHLYLLKKNNKIYRLYVEKTVDSADSLTENISMELSFGY